MLKVDYKAMKKGGFMRQVQKDCFAVRLRVVGGRLGAEQLAAIADIERKYGEGYVHLTSRQGIELPFIKLEDVADVKEALAKVGLEPGACGPRVRTVTACQGNAICPGGLIDTFRLAAKIDQAYFARDLPHKFKIGISGCTNNCLKAEENDLGIKGGMLVRWRETACSFCGLCAAVCPRGAIQLNREESRLFFDEQACSHCGKCLKSCPSEAWEGQSGYQVYFGGKYADEIIVGQKLAPLICGEEQVLRVVRQTIEFFEKHSRRRTIWQLFATSGLEAIGGGDHYWLTPRQTSRTSFVPSPL